MVNMKKLVVLVLILAVAACRLPTWIAPAPNPEDAVIAPMSGWMDLEILKQYPNAEIWPPIGVTKDTLIYRAFVYEDVGYIAVFGLVEDRWEILDVIKVMEATPAPTSSYKRDI